jgi:hypothetical protein
VSRSQKGQSPLNRIQGREARDGSLMIIRKKLHRKHLVGTILPQLSAFSSKLNSQPFYRRSLYGHITPNGCLSHHHPVGSLGLPSPIVFTGSVECVKICYSALATTLPPCPTFDSVCYSFRHTTECSGDNRRSLGVDSPRCP